MDEHWDYLVILDACRYDYFYKLYGEYFRGRLEKIISSGSTTLEWCKRSFQEKYSDIVYISANPYVNSKTSVKGFNAKNHFFRIVDVWDYGWDEGLGTVHPRRVNETFQTIRDKYPNKRLILHYLQPHAPYIGHGLYQQGFSQPSVYDSHVLNGMDANSSLRSTEIAEKVLSKVAPILDRVTRSLTGNLSWTVRELLRLPPASPMDAVRRMAGLQGLRRAYLANLRLVLKYVKELAENLSGDLVITSDHGELLGERGRYSHFAGSSDPVLREVPMLRIEIDKGM